VFRKQSRKRSNRRGVAIIAFVAALLVIGSFALWLFQMTATTALSSLSYYYGTSAFYAAESGLEMALRELNAAPPSDLDSDGTIGTISDNGNASDDPALTTARVIVTKTSSTPPLYEAEGRPDVTAQPWADFRRVIEIRTD